MTIIHASSMQFSIFLNKVLNLNFSLTANRTVIGPLRTGKNMPTKAYYQLSEFFQQIQLTSHGTSLYATVRVVPTFQLFLPFW